MKYAITTLTAAQVEIEEELVRLDKLKGHPNEELSNVVLILIRKD